MAAPVSRTTSLIPFESYAAFESHFREKEKSIVIKSWEVFSSSRFIVNGRKEQSSKKEVHSFHISLPSDDRELYARMRQEIIQARVAAGRSAELPIVSAVSHLKSVLELPRESLIRQEGIREMERVLQGFPESPEKDALVSLLQTAPVINHKTLVQRELEVGETAVAFPFESEVAQGSIAKARQCFEKDVLDRPAKLLQVCREKGFLNPIETFDSQNVQERLLEHRVSVVYAPRDHLAELIEAVYQRHFPEVDRESPPPPLSDEI